MTLLIDFSVNRSSKHVLLGITVPSKLHARGRAEK